MASPESQRIRAQFPPNGAEPSTVPIEIQRREWEAAAAVERLPDIEITPVNACGVPAEWVSSKHADSRRVLLYLHGGGFSTGSCVTHRDLASRLSLANGMRILVLDYRLAPENPFPAAVHDTVVAYQWLLNNGYTPQSVAFGGDSSGTTIAMSALMLLKAQKVTLPAAVILLSAWLDLALTGITMDSLAHVDPLCSRASLAQAAKLYLNGANLRDPVASPLYADLTGFPPILAQVGSHEVLVSDSIGLADRAKQVGVTVKLSIWNELWHVFQAWAGTLPEGQQAIDEIGEFLREYVNF